jgi:hypothetical protein
MTYDRERETIVTTDRRDNSTVGLIVGIIVILLLILLAIWYFGLAGGAGPSQSTAPGGGVTSPGVESVMPSASPS